MKFAVYPKSNINSVPPDTEEIHLSRPLKTNSAKKLSERCGHLHTITMSTSTAKRMSGKTKKFLKSKGIQIKIQQSKGRPLSLELEEMLKIIDLRKDFLSYGEIEKSTGIPKSTAHYLIKYANRGKIKKGQQVIHLK